MAMVASVGHVGSIGQSKLDHQTVSHKGIEDLYNETLSSVNKDRIQFNQIIILQIVKEFND